MWMHSFNSTHLIYSFVRSDVEMTINRDQPTGLIIKRTLLKPPFLYLSSYRASCALCLDQRQVTNTPTDCRVDTAASTDIFHLTIPPLSLRYRTGVSFDWSKCILLACAMCVDILSWPSKGRSVSYRQRINTVILSTHSVLH